MRQTHLLATRWQQFLDTCSIRELTTDLPLLESGLFKTGSLLTLGEIQINRGNQLNSSRSETIIILTPLN